MFNNCIALFLVHNNQKQVLTLAPTSGELNDHLRQENSASSFDMSPKKTAAPGIVLAPLDTNQDGLLLRET
jgi:hypothetical protein